MRLSILLFAVLFSSCNQTDDDSGASFFDSMSAGNFVDLTYSFDDSTVYWPTADGFVFEFGTAGETPAGFYYEAHAYRGSEHGGTHLDAPIHFSSGRQTVDEIPLERLIGPAVVVDVSKSVSTNRNYEITTDDVLAWESAHGRVPSGSIVLFRTGFGQYWPDLETYLGTSEKGPDAIAKLSFPGISPETASWLVTERDIAAVGIDTASIDRGQSTKFETHQILFAENIPAFENVANLELLPASGAVAIALPMKIAKGSGAPLRIVAWIAD